MKTLSALILGAACSISLSFIDTVKPAFAATENEPNSSFNTRQFLPSRTTTVTGELGVPTPAPFPDFDFSFSDSLFPGDVDTFTIPGLSPSQPFIAFTDNRTNSSTPDTILGTFDDSGSLISSNDDSGRGLFSALSGAVNADGTIRLGVTGFSDFGFVGNHFQSGDYELFVALGTSTLPPLDSPVQGDVDFFTFSNLLAGSPFSAEITSGTFDSILGFLDDSGNIIATDDDSGEGLLSLLSGIVPTSGRLNLAVTGFSDFGLTGNHSQTGSYTLSLTAQTVPESSSVLGVLAFSALGAGSLLKRKQHNKAIF